jgi:hypothetical protein
MQLIDPQDLDVGMFVNTGSSVIYLLSKTKHHVYDSYTTIQKDGRKNSYYAHCSGHKIQAFTDETLKQEYLDRNKEYIRSEGFRNLWQGVTTIGSDPECFVVDKNEKCIPSYLFLKSKEENDRTLEHRPNIVGSSIPDSGNQSIFWDGFQAEFNVCAKDCLSWVVDSTFLGLKTLQQKARVLDPDAKLSLKTTLDIDQDVLDNALPEHVAFGCMPSSNAYGMTGIKKDGREVSFRSAGGHIHLGLDNTDEARNIEYVKALDKILGVACVSLFAKYDDPRRREMYGLAGEYRTPKHGIEYRTLSNAWLSHPLIMNLVFDISRRCISTVQNDVIQYWDSTEEETISCINNCDVELAREILARNKMQFIQLIDSIRGGNGLAVYKIFMLGMDSIIKNPDDIEGNWGLNGQFQGHCEGEGMTLSKIRSLDTYIPLLSEEVTVIYEELVAAIKEIDVESEVQKQLTA